MLCCIMFFHVADIVKTLITVLAGRIESERRGRIELTQDHFGQTNKNNILGKLGMSNVDIKFV